MVSYGSRQSKVGGGMVLCIQHAEENPVAIEYSSRVEIGRLSVRRAFYSIPNFYRIFRSFSATILVTREIVICVEFDNNWIVIVI